MQHDARRIGIASRRSAQPLRTISIRRCIAAVFSPRITFTARQQHDRLPRPAKLKSFQCCPSHAHHEPIDRSAADVSITVVLCRDTVKAMRYRVGGILLLCALLPAVPAIDANASGCDGVIVGAGPVRCVKPGDTFKDCPVCPEMVVVPAGKFSMGSEASSDETPVHEVALARPFAVGKFEVTFAEWDACVADGMCGHVPNDQGFGRESRPVIDVSWNDVTNAYLPWLSRKAGRTYRLLSEAEWEYAARAGSRGVYAWGDEIGAGRANCDRCGSAWDNRQTAPVGSFAANAFGLHDLHGNVWEWTQDCYRDSYAGAPRNGAARQRANCPTRVVRGGGWSDRPRYLRSAIRYGDSPAYRGNYVGFRVARDR
jgi:formylglycine-generating enzyme required for sulfatase activity